MLPANTDSDNYLQTALRAGTAIASPSPIALPNGGQGVVIPDGYKLEKLDPLDQPITRIRATPRMDDANSFVTYVNRFKTISSVIFADLKANNLTAIIDYHHESSVSGAAEAEKDMLGKPDYGVHRVAHPCPWSIEWALWRAVDGKDMKQAELGRFLEEMLHTIASPAGADLLEIASELKVDREVKFKSGTRLNDGTVALGYEEIDQTSGRNGKITVPDLITIACPVFMGDTTRGFNARLRYRIDRGDLTFKIDIMNRLAGEQEAFHKVVEDVASLTGQPVFYGAP